MTWIDTCFIVFIMALLVWGVMKSRASMRGVSDFLAAGRTAGRYTICVSQGIAMLGAITIVANFEMYYQSGFPMLWWELLMSVVILFVTVSGWIVYRFRQTRALTMAQFFEKRYSRNFRIFTGLLAWLSGIVNYGIYPAVSARFFIYFCGLPASFEVLGLEVSTFVFLMVCLLVTALFFVFVGGQIAVIFTDFIQGIFVQTVFIVITVLFLLRFDFTTIFECLSARPEGSSYLNPFAAGETKHFNIGFFLIGVVGFIYNMLSWQGTQGYNASASSAHEARMGQILSNWRQIPQMTFLVMVAVCAYTLMNHAGFASQAEQVNAVLSAETNEAVQSQLTVPVVLSGLLPVGLMGAFAAVMLGAFITTNDTYLHSWGSILVQDVILPLRGRPLSPKRHLRLLRISILFVAVFAFFFSLQFRQTQAILLFFAVTGAIFAGGAGSVIIGGLYWKRGTTAAAWSSMITGSVVAVIGVLLHQYWEQLHQHWGQWFYSEKCPVDGQVFWLIAIVSSIVVYVLVSLLGRRQIFDMDRLLHRGRYALDGGDGDDTVAVTGEGRAGSRQEESASVAARIRRGIANLLGSGEDFTSRDRLICRVTYAWVFGWFLVFLTGTLIEAFCDLDEKIWMRYWTVFIVVRVIASVLIILWFTVGGVRDIRRMFGRLETMHRDERDDGRVRQ